MNDIILVVDYEKICRLCLQGTGAMSDLFADNGETSLKDLVFRATGVEVEPHDGFPTKICHRCRYIVELNCEMRDMVGKTQALIMNAGSHDLDRQQEITQGILAPEFQDIRNKQRKVKSDLTMVMQDDRRDDDVVTLVKPDPGTPVEEKTFTFRINDVEVKEESKVISTKSRNILPKHLTCQMCLTTFKTEAEVSSHVEIHYTDSNLTPYLALQRPYKCEHCNKCVSKTQLIKHHRSHLNINPFICKHPDCGFVGKSQDLLRRHVTRHGSRSVVCEVCGAAYRRRFELRQHTARAHRPAPAHCAHCRKRFRNQITLRAHVLHYHTPRRFKCEWPGCTKAYHTAAYLAAHARTHAARRQYRCHLCATAAYHSQSLLNRHLRLHARARLSKCDKCAATFDDYTAFYRHRVQEHGHWLAHKCTGCDKRFQKQSKLEEHLQVCQHVTTVQLEGSTEQLLVTTIQEMIDSEGTEVDQISGDGALLDKLKGRLVVQGSISGLGKELALQDLPADGLLYIEVDQDADDDVNDTWQQ